MSQHNHPRQPQQVLTTVWAAGSQDIAISSHDDKQNSWVAVRVGQVVTYAVGLEAPASIARIWTVAEDLAAALLPPTSPTLPHVDGPSVVVRLTGHQPTRDKAFPYDGRAGSGYIVVGGILWRPVDRAALSGIAAAWRRAGAIARVLTSG
ncbi:hypothetical protein [Micromonospora sp.]|uniref:hypothetical protein n=1 Tax=Micromonospora sp. TaxID=1876 RepID=UPI003B3B3B74